MPVAPSVTLLAAALLQSAASAPAPEARIVRPPDLNLLYIYPQTARAAGVEGSGTVTCKVSSAGELSDCRPVGEEPAGFGFGVAAANVAKRYRAEPAAPGAALPAEATFAIGFRLRPAWGPLVRVDAHDGWAVLQTPFVWQEFFPDRPRKEGVAGEVEVKCAPGRKGKATCEVVRETPEGYGYGKAALKVQQTLRLSPPPGGAQATGRVVRTTVRFDPRPKD